MSINGITILLYPEHPHIFVDSQFIIFPHMDIKFNSNPSNGKFQIELDDNFSITVEKCGDGLGGSMKFTTERTHKLSKQFSKLVKEISDLVKENPHAF